jgi:hypothetical protein
MFLVSPFFSPPFGELTRARERQPAFVAGKKRIVDHVEISFCQSREGGNPSFSSPATKAGSWGARGVSRIGGLEIGSKGELFEAQG